MFKILDCSLRDGGYYTNWDFPKEFVSTYLKAVRSLPIDMIEVGYRSKPTNGYKGRYFYLSREDLLDIKSQLRPDQKMAVMLNAKDCTPAIVEELIAPVNDVVDLVRFACPPSQLDTGIELARVVASLGVEVAMNVMYLNRYIDAPEMLQPLVGQQDIIQYVALVDSYGGVFPEDVEKIFHQANELLPQVVGFHGHDNISLGFANSLAAIRGGAGIVDATMTGMGRGAGNLATELICAYKQKVSDCDVDYTSLTNTLSEFSRMRDEYKWGTSLPYIVSGMSGLPQAEVMDWLGKRRYRPSSIIAALRGRANLGLDEQPYPSMSSLADGHGKPPRKVVIVGGGASAREHATALQRYVDDMNAIVIHSSLRNVDLLGSCEHQYICLPGQELIHGTEEQIQRLAKNISAWVVSAPPRLPNSTPDVGEIVQVQLPSEFEEGELGPVSDVAPLELAVTAALEAGAQEVYLFGFDGYQAASPADVDLMNDVQRAIDWFRNKYASSLVMESLLPTQYRIPVRSIYARDLVGE